MPAPSLPTGGCQYRLLDKGFTCGCQWFRPKRGKNLNSSACTNDEDDQCRCSHDACFHKLEPVHSHTSALADRPIVNTGNAAVVDPAALSSASRTTAQRKLSASRVPSSSKLAEAPLLRPPASGSILWQAKKRQKAPAQSRVLLPSSSLSAAAPKNELHRLRAQLKNLIDATVSLKSNQTSHHDRIETIESLPAALEDLSEKIELLDQGIGERHYSLEIRLESRLDEKLDERLAPLESFIKSYSERRGRHRQAKRGSAAVESSRYIKDDRERKRRMGSEPHSQHGLVEITTTTTTSFTTTRSTSTSFSASPPVSSRGDEVQALKFQLEQLRNRVADVEASSPPSATRPWEVEVVLIPPSTLLHGAWQDAESSVSSTQYTGSSELGLFASALPHTPNSVPTGTVPRSFSQKSKTYRRLASRGFVRRLHITGPTAREVAIAVESSFLHLLTWCASFSPASDILYRQNTKSQQCSGTDTQRTSHDGRKPMVPLWQPLRKIYKQTILEYIPPMDLATPALWTVDYLKANCMMRSSQRKVLYITPAMSPVPIRWGDVRQLERFTNCNAVIDQEESLVDEAIWEYDIKLDGMMAKERQNTLEDFMGGEIPSEKLAQVNSGGVLGVGKEGEQVAAPPDTALSPHPRLGAVSKPNTAPASQTAKREAKAPKNEGQTSSSTSAAKPSPSSLASSTHPLPPTYLPQSEELAATHAPPVSASASQSTNCPSEQHGRSSIGIPSAPPSFDGFVGRTVGLGLPEPEGERCRGEEEECYQGEDEEWDEDVLALFEDEEGAAEEVAIVGGVVGGEEILCDIQEEVEVEDELLLPPLPPLQQQVGGLSDKGMAHDSGDGGYISD